MRAQDARGPRTVDGESGAPLDAGPTVADVSPGRYDGSGSASPQWWPSRYGPDDRIGSGNELTPDRVLQALRLPTRGIVLELAQGTTAGVPAPAPRLYNQVILAHETLEAVSGSAGVNEFSTFQEQVTTSNHVGCHVDGLGHVGIAGRYYNGLHYSEIYRPGGLRDLGIDRARPWISRGVCLDVAGLVGVPALEEGVVVTAEHLQEASARQGVVVRAGDAVLVNTGWGALWGTDLDRYSAGEPGLGWDGAHWLTDRRPSIVGADNWGFDVVPFEHPDRWYVVHQHVITETGTHILENITTAALVAGQHWEFLFVLAPAKLAGATAAVVCPVAVV